MDNLTEPMDIDMSSHSSSAMDISFNLSANEINTSLELNGTNLQPTPVESTVPPIMNDMEQSTKQSTNINKFHIIRQKEPDSHNTTKIKIVCTVLILFLSVITYQVLNIQCADDINPDILKRSLSAKLYGQSRAVASLIEALSVGERSKIIFFYGGTGVGKTFTASMIMEHISYYSNMYHYTMPSFMDTFTTDFMIGLTVCKHTTIIVDDLSAKDTNIKTHIEDVITKSQNLDKNITVILIYNCDNAAKDFERQCDKSFPNKLLHNFNNINAFKKLIEFAPLTEEHLRKCIETEMGNRRLSNNDFHKILKNFNVSLDGCKGVYTKMKFLEIS